MKLYPILTLLLFTTPLIAEMKSSNMSSTTQPSSRIEGFKYLEKPIQKTPSAAPKQPLITVQPLPSIPQYANYLHPGILVHLNKKWEGGDHLLNLATNIGVYIAFIKPKDIVLDITEAELQKEVETIFNKASIKPVTLAPIDRPPLPAFQIEIFIYPIEKGYAAFCDGRLFESVIIDRFQLDPNMAFQAITWEKQTLMVSPKGQFAQQLKSTIQEIAATFVERFQDYARVDNE